MDQICLFNKWSYKDLEVKDISLYPYLAIEGKYSTYLPHTVGRYNAKKFHKASCPLVERLVCGLMMHGRNNGKKLKAIRILKHSFEIINLLTNENPIQILINAVVNSGPKEDSTRVGYTGTARRQSVDVSPLRRINSAIQLITMGARESAFRNVKTFSECLSEELINAARGSSNSYAIKKKDEIERVARANR